MLLLCFKHRQAVFSMKDKSDEELDAILLRFTNELNEWENRNLDRDLSTDIMFARDMIVDYLLGQ